MPPADEPDPADRCALCGGDPAGRCRLCGRPYCPQHGAVVCTPCGRLRQEGGDPRRPPRPWPWAEAVRCLLWGIVAGVPTFVVAYGRAFLTWDGESSDPPGPGILIWPVWLVERLTGPGGELCCLAPVVQWVGYSLLIAAVRAAVRAVRRRAPRKPAG